MMASRLIYFLHYSSEVIDLASMGGQKNSGFSSHSVVMVTKPALFTDHVKNSK